MCPEALSLYISKYQTLKLPPNITIINMLLGHQNPYYTIKGQMKTLRQHTKLFQRILSATYSGDGIHAIADGSLQGESSAIVDFCRLRSDKKLPA